MWVPGATPTMRSYFSLNIIRRYSCRFLFWVYIKPLVTLIFVPFFPSLTLLTIKFFTSFRVRRLVYSLFVSKVVILFLSGNLIKSRYRTLYQNLSTGPICLYIKPDRVLLFTYLQYVSSLWHSETVSSSSYTLLRQGFVKGSVWPLHVILII